MTIPQAQRGRPGPADLPDERLTIETRRLTKLYPGGTLAVDALDLGVEKGEFFGLLGPNGAGKTTTIGMLTTRVVPTGGEMWIAGINVRAHQQDVKRIIGVVTQFNTLDRRLTAWENLYHHGRYFGLSRAEARKEATRVLELVRLEERGKSLVDALSGGMQQRLLIGRALVHRPEVLFLDEPTTGIDPQGRLALWDILLQLHAQGQTILLTTHYMEEAERLCQRVAIMDNGKILAMGSPDELKRSVGAETIITLRAEPVTPALVAALENVSGVRSVEEGPRGLQVLAGASRGLVPQVAEAALAQDVQLIDIAVSTPTLETVFMRLTGRELRE
ncbi:MAG: ABC transporter ATP-binding protein [Chloroflexi bacterium]|nr:MAG: ABC transporter ATP-binding protein [Chloroflexota bacterium]